MATIIKPILWGETWDWRNNDFVKGESVKCDVYAYRGENRTFVRGEIAPHEDHGWTNAASDHYYLIISGSCEVYVGKDSSKISDNPIELAETTEFKAGDSFVIKADTNYNYRAGADGLKFTLFMNNLWEE